MVYQCRDNLQIAVSKFRLRSSGLKRLILINIYANVNFYPEGLGIPSDLMYLGKA